MDAAHIKALMERLNKTMTKALEAAAGMCIQRTHYEISVEHCLSKLLDQSGSDLNLIFAKLKIPADQVRADLDKSLAVLPAGNQSKPKFSAILLEAISQAWSFASLERGERKIRSGHLLIALLRDKTWLASAGYGFLAQLNEDQLTNSLDALTEGGEEVQAITPQQQAVVGSEALEAFTVDIVAQAKAGEMDPVIGRDHEIYQLVDILSRRRKNNPILVGEAGVGKSAIVEGLALLIADGNAPPALDNVAIRTLDMGLLKAGASMKGEFEERLKQVIEAVQGAPNPIILFIDEAHTLIGAGGSGGGDAANLLKPALARGKLRTIAATTWSEYKKYIEKDPALERRFQVVKVEEPDAEAAARMLRGLKGKYEKHHQVNVLDSAIEAAATLSARYISGRQLPDKAVDLLDTACARVKLSMDTPPYELTQLQNKLRDIETELAHKQSEHELTGELTEQLGRVQAQLDELSGEHEALDGDYQRQLTLLTNIKQWSEEIEQAEETPEALLAQLKEASDTLRNYKNPLVYHQVTPNVVSQIVSQWTGIPVGKMVDDELANILEIEGSLKQRVLGQDHAALRIGKAVKAAKAKVGNPDAPIGCFLCVGPSGTGKTEMALTLADKLFGGERFVIQVNMSEYQEKHTVSRLIGSPPGYVGYGEGGVLTEAVRQRPYSVVLLDEVEKGHPDVMNLFYQVFDKGHCADGEGRIIDFRNTVVMMTSNLGSAIIEEMCAEEPWPDVSELLEAIRPELNRFLKPALLARMSVIPYTPISEQVMKRIAGLKLRKIAKRLMDQHGMTLRVEADVIQSIADRCRLVEAGARNIDHILNAELLPMVAEDILRHLMEGELPKTLTVGMEEGGFHLNFS